MAVDSVAPIWGQNICDHIDDVGLSVQEYHSVIVMQVYYQPCCNQGPVSLSDKTPYYKISWSLEAARFVFRIVRSSEILPKCLSNFKAVW